jgi:DNA-binding response OmpR family regulator
MLPDGVPPTNDEGAKGRRIMTELCSSVEASQSGCPDGSSAAGYIVLYGLDVELLESRGLVLEAAGYLICLCTALAEVKDVIQTKKIDLLILCHSLSFEQSRDTATAIRALWPNIRILSLNNKELTSRLTLKFEAISDFLGPEVLITKISHILGRHDNPRPVGRAQSFSAHADLRLKCS